MPHPKTDLLVPGIILILAAMLRFIDLAGNPPGLFRDELEKGYTSLEIWKTARHGILGPDGIELSRPLPLFIEVFAGHDKTSAIYQYCSAPFVGIFGLGAVTARIVAAMAGTLTVLLLGLLARRLLGPVAGLVALASAAFHPTAIIFSRWAQQGVFVPLLTILGIWLLAEIPAAQEKHRRALAAAAALALALAAYAYDPARLVVPLILLACIASQPRSVIRETWKHLVLTSLLFAAIWIPLLLFTLSEGSARLSRVSVFSNGITDGVTSAAGNYLAHYSPEFLLWSGDINPRHHLPGSGLIALGTAILAAIALVSLAIDIARRRPSRRRLGLFLLAWLLAAPLAAAFTNEGIPHALRANLLLPATTLLAAYGATSRLLNTGNRRLITCSLLLAIDALQAATGVARLKHSPAGPWQAGLTDAIRIATRDGGRVYVSSDIPYATYAILFAEQTPPSQYHNQGLAACRALLAPPDQLMRLKTGEKMITFPPPGSAQALDGQYVVLAENIGETTTLARTTEQEQEE